MGKKKLEENASEIERIAMALIVEASRLRGKIKELGAKKYRHIEEEVEAIHNTVACLGDDAHQIGLSLLA